MRRRCPFGGYPSATMRTDMIDLAPPVEKAFLVAVDTGSDDGWTAEDSLDRARQPRDDGRRRRGRCRMAEPPPRRPELVRRQGQGRGARRGQARDRLRPARRRRRAVARPAARARGPAQRQGHRPQPADPRHLRAPRPDPRGPPPGRAGAARIPAAAPDQAVDPPVADPGRHRLARSGREPARDRPADHPDADRQDEGTGRAGPPAARDGGARPRPAAVADRRHRRLHECRQVHAAQLARRVRGGAGRGQAVRDARPDQPPGQARRRPDRDRHRHRRVHPQAPAPARRRLPGDARGGQPGRRPGRGRRRLRRALRGAPGDRPDRPRRARGRREAAPARVQQGGPARRGRARRVDARRRPSPARCSCRR